MRITAYDMAGAPQGQQFVKTGLGTGTSRDTAIRVFDSNGGRWPARRCRSPAGRATVGGLGAGYKVEWDAAAKHDQVLIEAVAGKFDVGGSARRKALPTPEGAELRRQGHRR
jgi:hypothetical protein